MLFWLVKESVRCFGIPPAPSPYRDVRSPHGLPRTRLAPTLSGMADERDEHAEERERIRGHYRAALERVAAISPEIREAELSVVREVAAARRRSAA